MDKVMCTMMAEPTGFVADTPSTWPSSHSDIYER